MDFLALPPEINSGRMYAGAGAGPLVSASAAWAALSADLAEAATNMSSTVTGLAAAWIGPSAMAMSAAAMSYVTWLTTTAAQAEQTAAQATAAVAAYEAAFAATVPPLLIAANRAQLAALVATNFLGMNTAAIMATEAQYAEMWAQDVAAMVSYATSSQAATAALPQFTPAPQTTNPAGLAAQAAATTQATATPAGAVGTIISEFLNGMTVPGFLETTFQSVMSSGAPFDIPLQLLSLFTVLWGINSPGSPLAQAITNRINTGGALVLPEVTIPASPAMPVPSSKFAEIKAGIGDGERLGGRLSVPPSWAKPRESEHRTPGAAAIGAAAIDAAPLAGLGGIGGLGGLAGMRGTPQKQKQPEPQYGTRSTVMPKHPFGG